MKNIINKNIKIKLLIIIGLGLVRCNTIKIDNKNNVAFIYYTNTNFSYKKANTYYYKKTKITYNHYIFQFDDRNINDLKFYHRKYKNFDTEIKNIKMLNFKVNKSFLRKNKDVILTEEKIKKMGREKFITLLYKVDMVFLIDENMIENNKITIMEMNFSYNAEE